MDGTGLQIGDVFLNTTCIDSWQKQFTLFLSNVMVLDNKLTMQYVSDSFTVSSGMECPISQIYKRYYSGDTSSWSGCFTTASGINIDCQRG